MSENDLRGITSGIWPVREINVRTIYPLLSVTISNYTHNSKQNEC